MKDKIVVTESKENLEGILNLRLIQIKDEDLSVDAKEAIAGYIEPLLEKWRQDIQEKDKMSKLEKEKEFNMCSDATVSINHREAGDVSKYDEDRAAGDVSKFEDVATGEVSMCEGRAADKVSNYDNSHTSARSKLQGNQEFIVAPSKHVWTPSKTGVPVDPPKHVLKTDDEIEERVDEKKTVVSLLLAKKNKPKTFSNMKGISAAKDVSRHGRRVNIIFKKTELALSFFEDVGKMDTKMWGHCVLLSLEELGIQHTPSITEEQMMRLAGGGKGSQSDLFDSREKMDVSTVDDKLIFSFESVDSANAFIFSKSCNKKVLNSLGQLKGTSLNDNEFTLEADKDGFFTLQGPLDKFQAELLGELNFEDFKITSSSDYKKVYISLFGKVIMFKILLSESARQMKLMLHKNHFVRAALTPAQIFQKSESVDVVKSLVEDIVKAALDGIGQIVRRPHDDKGSTNKLHDQSFERGKVFVNSINQVQTENEKSLFSDIEKESQGKNPHDVFNSSVKTDENGNKKEDGVESKCSMCTSEEDQNYQIAYLRLGKSIDIVQAIIREICEQVYTDFEGNFKSEASVYTTKEVFLDMTKESSDGDDSHDTERL